MESYEGPDGKRHIKTATAHSSSEAKLISAQLRVEIGKGIYTEPSKMPIKMFLEQWLSGQVKTTVSPRTHELYDYIAHKHLIPAFGNVPLCQLKPQRIQSLYADKLTEGLSARTVQLQHVCLHKALDNAVRIGLIPRNPCDSVDQPRIERRAMKTMTEDNITQFLNEARKTDYYALFFLLLFTGMRRGEALSLRWGDIDLKGAQLSINRNMQCIKGKISYKSPKTASSRRRLDLSPNTCVVLGLHKEKKEAIRKELNGPKLKDGDLVFCHTDDSPYLPDGITHAWMRLAARCGIPDIRLHDSRHTHATLLLKAGVNVKVIQERLGHANFSTTMNLYAHVSPGMQKEAASRFDDIVMGTPNDKLITVVHS
jgi:integrase